jgi:DNA-directed RNA polymerase subunit RPC12/RpoP
VNELDQKTEKISCRSCGFSILYKRRTAKRNFPHALIAFFYSQLKQLSCTKRANEPRCIMFCASYGTQVRA